MAEQGKTVGQGSCPVCGASAPVKVNKKGHLYLYCPTPADGGCGQGMQSRSDKADGLIAARVTAWRDAEARKRFQALAPTRTPAKPSIWDREWF
jgi:hypothetical protein